MGYPAPLQMAFKRSLQVHPRGVCYSTSHGPSRDVVELSHAFLGIQSLKTPCQMVAIPPSESHRGTGWTGFLVKNKNLLEILSPSYNVHMRYIHSTNIPMHIHIQLHINSYSNN